jgi:hypothetical protein
MLRSIVQDQRILNEFTCFPDDSIPAPIGMLTIVFDNELYQDAILRCRTPKGFHLPMMLTKYYGKASPQTWQIMVGQSKNQVKAIVHDVDTPLKVSLVYSDPPNLNEDDSESS